MTALRRIKIKEARAWHMKERVRRMRAEWDRHTIKFTIQKPIE